MIFARLLQKGRIPGTGRFEQRAIGTMLYFLHRQNRKAQHDRQRNEYTE